METLKYLRYNLIINQNLNQMESKYEIYKT